MKLNVVAVEKDMRQAKEKVTDFDARTVKTGVLKAAPNIKIFAAFVEMGF